MTSKTWRLKRVTQCAKCPWKKSANPHDIPNYSTKKHKSLASTIAGPPDLSQLTGKLNVMVCHETADAHCIGWLDQQLGPGNNIALRLQMLSCENAGKIRTIGPQHDTFEDTLPPEAKNPDNHS